MQFLSYSYVLNFLDYLLVIGNITKIYYFDRITTVLLPCAFLIESIANKTITVCCL